MNEDNRGQEILEKVRDFQQELKARDIVREIPVSRVNSNSSLFYLSLMLGGLILTLLSFLAFSPNKNAPITSPSNQPPVSAPKFNLYP